MPATDMLEHFIVCECVGLPLCNLEGSSAPYKVSLLYIADQKLYTLRIYTCFKCTVRSKQTCVLKAYGRRMRQKYLARFRSPLTDPSNEVRFFDHDSPNQ